MHKFIDVLNVLKQFNIYIHLGDRLWDIELAAIEVDNLYRAGVVSAEDYTSIKLVLRHEHEMELEQRS